MDDFKAYRWSVTWRSVAIGIGIALFAALIMPDNLPVAWGLLLGFAGSLLRFRFSAGSLMAFAGKSPREAKGYMVRRRFGTYALTGAVLVIAFWREEINQWATVGGLFLTTVVICIDAVLRGRSQPPPVEDS